MALTNIQIDPVALRAALAEAIVEPMRERADRVVAEAKRTAPYDTGLYRDGTHGQEHHPDHPRRVQRAQHHLGAEVDLSTQRGIHREDGPDSSQLIVADAPYARYIEFGTSRMEAFHTLGHALDAAGGH